MKSPDVPDSGWADARAVLWIMAEPLMVLAAVVTAIVSRNIRTPGAIGAGLVMAPNSTSAAILLFVFAGFAAGAAHAVNLLLVQRVAPLGRPAALRLAGALAIMTLLLPVFIVAAGMALGMLGLFAGSMLPLSSAQQIEGFGVLAAVVSAAIVGLMVAMVMREAIRVQAPVLEPVLIALRRAHYSAAVGLAMLPIASLILFDLGWVALGEFFVVALVAMAASSLLAATGWRRVATAGATWRVETLLTRTAIAMVVFAFVGFLFGATLLK